MYHDCACSQQPSHKSANFYVLRFGISLQVESCFRWLTARTTHITLSITWQKWSPYSDLCRKRWSNAKETCGIGDGAPRLVIMKVNYATMLPISLKGHSSLTTVSSSRIHTQVQTTANHWTLGEFVRKDLIPFEQNLSDAVPECIIDEDKKLFLNFMRRMLCWLLEDRATAKELTKDLWLDFTRNRPKGSVLKRPVEQEGR